MTRISKDFDGQTVICTFDVTPGSAQDVVDALTEAYDRVISRQPGYVSGAIHLNDAQTRIATYSQWRDRRDYQAMREMYLSNPQPFDEILSTLADVESQINLPETED